MFSGFSYIFPPFVELRYQNKISTYLKGALLNSILILQQYVFLALWQYAEADVLPKRFIVISVKSLSPIPAFYIYNKHRDKDVARVYSNSSDLEAPVPGGELAKGSFIFNKSSPACAADLTPSGRPSLHPEGLKWGTRTHQSDSA